MPFKKIIAVILFMAMANGFGSVLGEDVTISFSRPVNDLVVDVGYDLFLAVKVAPASSVQSVELYRNGDFVEELDQGNAGVYTFQCLDMPLGNFNFTARAITSTGVVETEVPKKITVAPLIRTMVANETFDRFSEGQQLRFLADAQSHPDGGVEFIPPGFNYSFIRSGLDSISITDKDSDDAAPPIEQMDSGEAVHMVRTARSGDTGAARMIYKGAGMGSTIGRVAPLRRMAMEMDIYFEHTGQLVRPFNFRQSKGSGTNEIMFIEFDRQGRFIKPTEGDVPAEYTEYQGGKWHHVRVEVDMGGKVYDAYLDGERVVKQRDFTPAPHFEENGVIVDCIQLYAHPTGNQTMNFYIDNIQMFDYETPPLITNTRFYKDNKLVWDKQTEAPVDSEVIELGFNSTIDAASIKNKASLVLIEGDQELAVPFTVETQSTSEYINRYRMKPRNILRKNATYHIKLSPGVRNNAGVESSQEQYIEFTTEKPELYVDRIDFGVESLEEMGSDGTIQAHIVNDTSTAKDLKLVCVFYQDGEMEKIEYIDLVATVGRSVTEMTLSLPQNTTDGKLSVFVWNHLVDFNPLYYKADLQ